MLGCVSSPPAARGSQAAGITQPSLRFLFHVCTSKRLVVHRLRDPASWLPLAARASSRNLGHAFLRDSVHPSLRTLKKKRERERERERGRADLAVLEKGQLRNCRGLGTLEVAKLETYCLRVASKSRVPNFETATPSSTSESVPIPVKVSPSWLSSWPHVA